MTQAFITKSRLIYFSSVSKNTERFVRKLNRDAQPIPLYARDVALEAVEPFVLVLPTYGGAKGEGSVPKQVIRFLNNPRNRSLVRGVIGAGNTNFSDNYCAAAHIVSAKCKVPVLYQFELMGTPEDVQHVNAGLDDFWAASAGTSDHVDRK